MTLAWIQRGIVVTLLLLGAALGVWLTNRYGINRWWAIPIALAANPIGHALLLALDFCVAEASDKKTIERSGIAAVLRAYGLEIIDSLRVFAWLQPFFVHKPMPSAAPSTQTSTPLPVLFLHGYFCNRAMWLPLAKHLTQHPTSGNRLLDAISMEPAFGSIDKYTDQIHAAVMKLHRLSNQPVVLIGHSMGGLAARAYLRKFGRLNTAGVITLGTPHQGTFLAEFGHGTNTKQMRQGNEWLAQLSADESRNGLPPFEVILSLHDNIVSPRPEQTIPQANTQMVEGLGHINLAMRRDIWRLIDKQLSQWDSQHRADA
jgi:triacylglycerol lipase